MRAKDLLGISLGLNVALAAGVGVCLFQLQRRAREATGPRPVVVTTNSPIRVAKTNVVLNPRAFSWRDVESTNYEAYVFNLRALGCPESTVRDIIVADVNQLYARKRRELNVATNDPPWWRSEPTPEEMDAALARAQALETERRALLTRLLGPHWDQPAEPEPEPPVLLAGPVLGQLSDEQKHAVQEIVARSRQALRDYVRAREERGEAPDPVELARLREHTRQELEQKLTPAQLEEFLLRYSHNANRLREELRGFNATPEEFRKLFLAVDPIDRRLQLLPEDDPAQAGDRQQLETLRETTLLQTLGEERYDAYRALHDPEYKEALAQAREAGASREAALALYELNRTVASEKERINADPSLSRQEKEQELKALELQRETARAELLGLEPPPEARPKPKPPPHWEHNTLPGETLADLSHQYRVPLAELLKANPGLGQGVLPPGQTVIIPQPKPVPPPFTPAFVPPFGRAGEPPR